MTAVVCPFLYLLYNAHFERFDSWNGRFLLKSERRKTDEIEKMFSELFGKKPVQAALAEDQNGDQRTQAGQKSVEEIVLPPGDVHKSSTKRVVPNL